MEAVADSRLNQIPRLNKRMASLESQIKSLDKQTDQLRADGKAKDRELDAQRKTIARMDPTKVTRSLSATEARATDLAKKFQLVYLQQLVASELRFLHRERPETQGRVLAAVAKALDYSGDWWMDKNGLSLTGWTEVLMAADPEAIMVNAGGDDD